jgi:hypothetical protein
MCAAPSTVYIQIKNQFQNNQNSIDVFAEKIAYYST